MNIAWLAGFFDGEGSIFIVAPCEGHGAMLNVSLTQSDSSILKKIKSIWGGTLSRYPAINGGVENKVGRLQWRGGGARSILEAMLPYSHVKAAQIESAISFLDRPWRQTGLGGNRVSLTEDQKAIDAMYATEIKFLKPRNWPKYDSFTTEDEVIDYAFGKVCELHPE